NYSVNVDGRNFNVTVGPGGAPLSIQPATAAVPIPTPPPASSISRGETVTAPMAGNILKINVNIGDTLAEGDIVVIMEAMKMETEVRSKVAGSISAINVKEGTAVAVGDILVTL
ncbi:MAG: biotin/lipoyl-containing protein, partial [Gammaproteobacteria bacterium]